jgi:hypothetical protein
MYGQQHVTLYTCSSILVYNALAIRPAQSPKYIVRITVDSTYHSRFIPEEVVETSQTFLRDAHFYQNDLAMRNTADVSGGKPFAVCSKS